MGMIAVTGASGFLGAPLCASLERQGRQVRRLLRSARGDQPGAVVIGDLGGPIAWSEALGGVETLVHCAARVHVMKETEQERAQGCRTINLEASLRLGEAAAAQGVKRMVFLSSIKVNGESTPLGAPFRDTSIPAPEDAYGRSKWEAEQALSRLAAATGMELVVIRPPLVYGPKVRANFLRLLRLVDRGVPLPLGAVHNRRSLVALDNLIDLIECCLDHPAAAGKVFLASDGEDLSTPELIRALAVALGRPARLLPVPAGVLRRLGRLGGRSAEVDRLIGSLQVDSAATRETLAWTPPVSLKEGLQRCCDWYQHG